jgi:ribosomal protein S18 acetylase RimI-like enzyme
MKNMFKASNIRFVDATCELKNRLRSEWGEKVTQHMHMEDGFSILAMQGDAVVGLISVYWKQLPPPLPETTEGYIDILEVHKDFRRMGIATQLIDLSFACARKKGVYQLRAWSSLDKLEVIPMWKALGFGLCPATTYPGGQEVKGYFVTRLLNSLG